MREYLKRNQGRNLSLYSSKAHPAATVFEIRQGVPLRRDIQLAESCFSLESRIRIIGWKERLRDDIWLAEAIGKLCAAATKNDECKIQQHEVSNNAIDRPDMGNYWELLARN